MSRALSDSQKPTTKGTEYTQKKSSFGTGRIVASYLDSAIGRVIGFLDSVAMNEIGFAVPKDWGRDQLALTFWSMTAWKPQSACVTF